MSELRVLVVEETTPAPVTLAPLLRSAAEVRTVVVAGSSLDAIRLLQVSEFDLVCIDVAMPGMNGFELATLITKFSSPPAIALVADHDEGAMACYELGVFDYLLRPVESERLRTTLHRAMLLTLGNRTLQKSEAAAQAANLPALPVDVDGATQYVRREDVQIVEARGNYIRLHTLTGKYELRMPLSTLEDFWQDCGFLRVHRSFLVCVSAVRELRIDKIGGAELLARTDVGEVPVSRKHARPLRAALKR